MAISVACYQGSWMYVMPQFSCGSTSFNFQKSQLLSGEALSDFLCIIKCLNVPNQKMLDFSFLHDIKKKEYSAIAIPVVH